MPIVNPQTQISGITNTSSVRIDPGYNVVNISSTILLPSVVAGSTSGVSVSGTTLVSPESGKNIKVYAFSLSTTGVVSVTSNFTNGSGASPVNFWQVALQAPSGVASGANLAVTPPGYLFSTGTNTTLSLKLDSSTIVHYTICYFKESS